MRSSSVVQTCCGPVHAERKFDSIPVLAAVLLVWCCPLLADLNVYEGRLIESVLYYGVFFVDSRAFRDTAGGLWELGDTSTIVCVRFALCSLLCVSCPSSALSGVVSRKRGSVS